MVEFFVNSCTSFQRVDHESFVDMCHMISRCREPLYVPPDRKMLGGKLLDMAYLRSKNRVRLAESV